MDITKLTGFTPGPWTLDVEYDGDPEIDPEAFGVEILVREINRLMHSSEWADAEDWERDLANSRLIAAAPDLLELAKHGLELADMIGRCAPRDHIELAASALREKARE